MKPTQIMIFTVALLFTSSCDFPEHYFTPDPNCNSNAIEDLGNEKQKELVAKLRNVAPKEYRYYFKTFKEEGNNTYMITNFRNDESCFDIKMLVDKWDRLAGMKRTNGKSYPKELYDLKWKIESIDGAEVVKYLSMHKIID